MRPEQWQVFKAVAKGGRVDNPPVALIVDSPWIPGYTGISHLDYFLDPELWFQANMKVVTDFPSAICLPSWWVEYGMAIEPSAIGNRIHFWKDQPPAQSATLFRLEDIDSIALVNPQTDGYMPFALRLYERHLPKIRAAGYTVPMVAARGPLCVASFLRGVTQFMLDIVENPEGVHKLLGFTTKVVIDWLKAQAEVIGESAEGILVLDDIAGFLSARSYRDFAHPYLQQITSAFPADWVKVYHNDANVRPFLADLPDTGFDVLNWSHKIDVAEAREKTCGRIRLMGNVPPLDIGVNGTPEMVKQSAREVIEKSGGSGLILSVGGGVSPGMPAENITALIEAAGV
jgi:uroporphyrinogen decarboxylase